jgi:hypothetical protein
MSEEVLVLLFVVPLAILSLTVGAIVRAYLDRDIAWLAAPLLSCAFGLGWIVPIVYFAAVVGPRRVRQRRADARSPPERRAGWHADPWGRWDRRFWDGQRWTEHVLRGSEQGVDPL